MPRLTGARAHLPLIAVALVALLAGAMPAQAATTPAPSGLKFYRPPAKLIAGKHGTVIWSRTVGKPVALTGASKTILVLYRSTSVAGKPIAVSGSISLPKGTPPKGGWPILSWAHGTTGIADVCAPTRSPNSAYTDYVTPQLQSWLRQGYAVVRTDYEGLGGPGVHPYLIGKSEGRGVLDIARAGRVLDKQVGTKLVIAGHSQGGHAALWAAALAPSWTPDLAFRGVAAFAPASHILEQAKLAKSLTAPGGGLSGIGSLVLGGAAAVSTNVKINQLVTAPALLLVPQIGQKCLDKLSLPNSWGGLPPADIVKPTANTGPLYGVLGAQNPGLKITKPVLLLQGDADTTVFPNFTTQLNGELVGKGDTVKYTTYPGVNHGEIVAKAATEATAFLKARTK
jgi:pimeloyl-ACP methyl ester carboxylesterase